MSDQEHLAGNSSREKNKWLTYGGRVDENLMNLLKEAQKTAGIKKFSDFMNDMLNIYRANKQETEPPQMQVIKKAVADIITTTESLLGAMQIVEDDKFRSIEAYRQRLLETEEDLAKESQQIEELEGKLAGLEKELSAARLKTQSAHTELATEIEKRKNIEGMIRRIQQFADDAVSKREKAEAECKATADCSAGLKNEIITLRTVNQDLQTKLDTALEAVEQGRQEFDQMRDSQRKLSEALRYETILRNRLEERLQIIGPQHQAALTRLETLQSEINSLQVNGQKPLQQT
ncbi:hypothetical protein HSX37_01915|uniref:Replication region DNA-binding N-term n=1 Tax=Dendrosporobacter quercicolus TaxID=146817 RepID=A0A1G9LS65_9FIRM|nr:hypothetical protein [Dendrosporobacter quercicolus]NSL46812.1 hypothetical protein [Dendrosporobacter quercicolus DSM 1736]SDL64820.1 hypothetical protein SAMN04488502_101451 [Dendrosporobacter quercicolus]